MGQAQQIGISNDRKTDAPGRPGGYRVRACCGTCRYSLDGTATYLMEWECFCHLDGSEVPRRECVREDEDAVWTHEDPGWDTWAAAHAVVREGICPRYAAREKFPASKEGPA